MSNSLISEARENVARMHKEGARQLGREKDAILKAAHEEAERLSIGCCCVCVTSIYLVLAYLACLRFAHAPKTLKPFPGIAEFFQPRGGRHSKRQAGLRMKYREGTPMEPQA